MRSHEPTNLDQLGNHHYDDGVLVRNYANLMAKDDDAGKQAHEAENDSPSRPRLIEFGDDPDHHEEHQSRRAMFQSAHSRVVQLTPHTSNLIEHTGILNLWRRNAARALFESPFVWFKGRFESA